MELEVTEAEVYLYIPDLPENNKVKRRFDRLSSVPDVYHKTWNNACKDAEIVGYGYRFSKYAKEKVIKTLGRDLYRTKQTNKPE